MERNPLEEIEEIKKLKAKYFRLMDKKLWVEWSDVFTEDVTAIYHGPRSELRYEGRDDIVAQISTALADAVSVHHGYMPEIELTSSTTATGIWAMFDYIQRTGLTMKGYGHYEEDYAKEDGKWRIKNFRLTRLRIDVMSNNQDDNSE
ncbi:nuclear transport factor 2 family protein [Chloroflexota bacterium]